MAKKENRTKHTNNKQAINICPPRSLPLSEWVWLIESHAEFTRRYYESFAIICLLLRFWIEPHSHCYCNAQRGTGHGRSAHGSPSPGHALARRWEWDGGLFFDTILVFYCYLAFAFRRFLSKATQRCMNSEIWHEGGMREDAGRGMPPGNCRHGESNPESKKLATILILYPPPSPCCVCIHFLMNWAI